MRGIEVLTVLSESPPHRAWSIRGPHRKTRREGKDSTRTKSIRRPAWREAATFSANGRLPVSVENQAGIFYGNISKSLKNISLFKERLSLRLSCSAALADPISREAYSTAVADALITFFRILFEASLFDHK